MHESHTIRFADAVAAIGREARALGLRPPGFASPPRLPDVQRSIRRHASGQATVSVAVRGRPWAAVLSDLIEGVIAANRIAGPAADLARARLWDAAGPPERPSEAA